MTTINIATDIPSNINTVEKLALWCCLVLQKNNPTKAVVEIANGTPEKCAQVALIRADDDSIRSVLRLSLEIASDYAEVTTKFWESALELSNVDIPAAYKSN